MLGQVRGLYRNVLVRITPIRAALASQVRGNVGVRRYFGSSYKTTTRKLAPVLLVGVGTAGALFLWSHSAQARENSSSANKYFTLAEVAKHNSQENGVWVVYRDGVYDITNFVEQHPGGVDKIMLAAGGHIEPYWKLYQQHYTEQVQAILESFRIGDLDPSDMHSTPADPADPFANEPKRITPLRVISEKPFNAETPPNLLVQHYITPIDLFFVRNHLPVPSVDAQTYTLEIHDRQGRKATLSLDELKKQFPKKTITAVLQCSGNRRREMHEVQPIKGLDWSQGGIGNAQWSGVMLCDVLKRCGFNCDNPDPAVRHVQFEGLDHDATGTTYTASVPVERVVNRANDVMLAYEMNGQELPQDHGYPLRVIVPGVTGARSVKWVGRIVLSEDECQGHWQQKDYKVFSPSIDWNNVDWSSAPAIQESNVQSAICEPRNDSVLEVNDDDGLTVRGYAFSGGGRAIIRVDVSADGGVTWQPAVLESPQQPLYRSWAWTLWSATLPVRSSSGTQQLQLVARAVDSACNSQPIDIAAIWNLRGVMNNAWHRVNVNVKTSD